MPLTFEINGTEKQIWQKIGNERVLPAGRYRFHPLPTSGEGSQDMGLVPNIPHFPSMDQTNDLQSVLKLQLAAHTDKDGIVMWRISLLVYSQFCNESLYIPSTIDAVVVKTGIKTKNENAKEKIIVNFCVSVLSHQKLMLYIFCACLLASTVK